MKYARLLKTMVLDTRSGKPWQPIGAPGEAETVP